MTSQHGNPREQWGNVYPAGYSLTWVNAAQLTRVCSQQRPAGTDQMGWIALGRGEAELSGDLGFLQPLETLGKIVGSAAGVGLARR